MDKRATTTDEAPPHVPEGFVSVMTSNKKICIVPQFLIPATNQAFDAYHKKIDNDIENAIGGVSVSFSKGYL